MSDIIVDLVRDSKVETLLACIMGISSNSHLLLCGHNHLEPKIISICDDYDSERVYGNSLEERTSSSESSENLSSNIFIEVNRAKDHIQLFPLIDKCKPHNIEVKAYLDLRDQSVVMEHDWVDTKIAGTSSFLSIRSAIGVA